MKRSVTVCLLLLFLSACEPQAKDVKETRFILGTIVEFTIYTEHETLALKAIAEASSVMRQVEAAFTTFGLVENSVKRFNQAKAGQVVVLDAEVNQLLLKSVRINKQTKGGFDPTLGALNKLWGFSGEKLKKKPPTSKEIEKTLKKTGVDNIKQQGQGWVKKVGGLQLDFGAIAKGYAIDKATAVIKKYGFSQAIINAGGDMIVLGSHGSQPWRVAIRHPREKKPLGWIAVGKDMSIVTSGDYERFYMYDGRRYHHILSPQTGYPARNNLSVTTIAPTASVADAWSTGLFVLKQEKALNALKTQNDIGALWLFSDGKKRLSPNISKFVHFE